MNSDREENEYDILGYKLRVKPNEKSRVPAADIVEAVRKETNGILDRFPHLKPDQVAILAALNLAEKNCGLEKEYRDSIEALKSSASDALQFIEEVSAPPR